MQYEVVGIFKTYAQAEAAVRELELAGINGEQVELIDDLETDARTVNTPGEPATSPHKKQLVVDHPSGKEEISADAGEQPNFIGRQEYYAAHLKQGGAVMIVRAPTDQTAGRAAEIMRDNGGRTPGRKGGPTAQGVA
jgi:hypothetical protein